MNYLLPCSIILLSYFGSTIVAIVDLRNVVFFFLISRNGFKMYILHLLKTTETIATKRKKTRFVPNIRIHFKLANFS